MNTTHTVPSFSRAVRRAPHASAARRATAQKRQQQHWESYASVEAMVATLRPADPVYTMRPHAIRNAAGFFLEHFPGRVMFAVKTNPHTRALQQLCAAGIADFDVASLDEIKQVASVNPRANMFYMHPVKPMESIQKAYFEYGVRAFSLDSHVELDKIQRATNFAKDLQLFVRISIPNEHAALALTGKFGVPMAEAADLLTETARVADKVGVCFHVGSQSMNPGDYRVAIMMVSDLVDRTGVQLDFLDVGGGFPAAYPGMVPPAMIEYMSEIRTALDDYGFAGSCEVFCEPGRALVAESGSSIVRVDLRKDNMLYINDGVYGSLFDAGTPEFKYPVKAIRPDGEFKGELVPFGFYGPTCDSMDTMKGPFMLPSDIRDGDWIEVGQLGAYGMTFRTRFNGFYSDKLVAVADNAMMSMYPEMDAATVAAMQPGAAKRIRIAK
jgi:ornithine decarboxylase